MERFQPKPSSGHSPFIVAHRGISGKAPENTLAAIKLALDTPGIDMIEIDVRLSKDGEVIVLHDRTLQRTTTGNGPARKYDLAELKTFDAGSWFDPRFSEERIPTLKEILDLAKDRLFINIEMKSDPFFREPDGLLEGKVLNVVRDFGLEHRVLFSSFRHRMVANIKKKNPHAATGVIFNLYTDFFTPPALLASKVGANVFVCAKYELRKSMIRDARKHRIAIYIYTLNAVKEVLDIAAMGVDGILSDNADEVVAVLQKQ